MPSAGPATCAAISFPEPAQSTISSNLAALTVTHGPERTLTHATHRAGYFSKELAPVATVASGDEIKVEMATHHACDDWDKMIKGDAGMESIFTWDADGKSEDYRGATGGGDGVHVLTGPIFVTDAEPGDILKVEILDLAPRQPSIHKPLSSNKQEEHSAKSNTWLQQT